jgi:hypothetical protein
MVKMGAIGTLNYFGKKFNYATIDTLLTVVYQLARNRT